MKNQNNDTPYCALVCTHFPKEPTSTNTGVLAWSYLTIYATYSYYLQSRSPHILFKARWLEIKRPENFTAIDEGMQVAILSKPLPV